MKHCPNCGAKLVDNTKFCTQCGNSLKDNNVNKGQVNLVEESLNQPNKGKRLFIALLAILVLAIVIFIGKSFLNDMNPIEKPFSIEEQLSKIEGKWYDPTGVILGEKEAIIFFNKKGNIVIGKDEKGLFKANISPFGSNNYQAIVALRGVEGDFELHFYEEENKLVFFSTLTKSSWYLKKDK
jgi:hypothetical protein